MYKLVHSYLRTKKVISEYMDTVKFGLPTLKAIDSLDQK